MSIPCHNVRVLGKKLFASQHFGESSFCTIGFNNWRTPKQDFQKHENSERHRESVEKWRQHCKGTAIDVQLSNRKEEEQKANRSALMNIITSIQFLARQGLSLRGHDEQEGNFPQLLQLRSNDIPSLSSFLNGKVRRKYLSHENQNEILKLMADTVLRDIISRVSDAKYFSVIGDEVTDVAGKQQLGICLRWVDKDFFIHEDFVGLYEVNKADACHLSTFLLDVLTRFNLDVHSLRGQGYDGTALMSGKWKHLRCGSTNQ